MNTGEFAKRCRTEKRTIFHYEQMGLLTPAAVHENGYREFSESQLEIMDMIKVLQAAGFTLRETQADHCQTAGAASGGLFCLQGISGGENSGAAADGALY